MMDDWERECDGGIQSKGKKQIANQLDTSTNK